MKKDKATLFTAIFVVFSLLVGCTPQDEKSLVPNVDSTDSCDYTSTSKESIFYQNQYLIASDGDYGLRFNIEPEQYIDTYNDIWRALRESAGDGKNSFMKNIGLDSESFQYDGADREGYTEYYIKISGVYSNGYLSLWVDDDELITKIAYQSNTTATSPSLLEYASPDTVTEMVMIWDIMCSALKGTTFDSDTAVMIADMKNSLKESGEDTLERHEDGVLYHYYFRDSGAIGFSATAFSQEDYSAYKNGGWERTDKAITVGLTSEELWAMVQDIWKDTVVEENGDSKITIVPLLESMFIEPEISVTKTSDDFNAVNITYSGRFRASPNSPEYDGYGTIVFRVNLKDPWTDVIDSSVTDIGSYAEGMLFQGDEEWEGYEGIENSPSTSDVSGEYEPVTGESDFPPSEGQEGPLLDKQSTYVELERRITETEEMTHDVGVPIGFRDKGFYRIELVEETETRGMATINDDGTLDWNADYSSFTIQFSNPMTTQPNGPWTLNVILKAFSGAYENTDFINAVSDLDAYTSLGDETYHLSGVYDGFQCEVDLVRTPGVNQYSGYQWSYYMEAVKQ